MTRKQIELKERLLSSSAREEAEKIANEAILDSSLLKDLVWLFCNDVYRVGQRSSWVFALLAEKNSSILVPYESIFLESIQNPNAIDTTKRNVMRIWSLTGVSSQNDGLIFDKCMDYITGHEAIAIKVHSMSVAYEIAKPFPELRNELKVMVEDLFLRESGSAGIRSKCKRMLKDLAKLDQK